MDVRARTTAALLLLTWACVSPTPRPSSQPPNGSVREYSAKEPGPLRQTDSEQRPASAIGVRAGILLADGEPANDIQTIGVHGRHRIAEGWRLGAAVDFNDFDFERPAKILGLTQDPAVETVDAKASATTLSVWIENSLTAESSANDLYWMAGLGASFVDVDDVTGPLAGGGSFDITTDAGTEILASAGLGYRRYLTRELALELLVRADQHFADWKVEDRSSGASGTVDDYFSWAFLVGASWGF